MFKPLVKNDLNWETDNVSESDNRQPLSGRIATFGLSLKNLIKH